MNCLIRIFVIFGLFVLADDSHPTPLPQGEGTKVFAGEGMNVRFRSDGNGIWAFSEQTGKPVWSRDGLLYRERYDRNVEKEMYAFPSRAFVESEDREIPLLYKHGRVYAILSKRPPRLSAQSDFDELAGNVLIALDAETEGQLVFRVDSAALIYDGRKQERFNVIRSLVDDVLTVETIAGAVLAIDVSTGEPVFAP